MVNSRVSNFRSLSPTERRNHVAKTVGLTPDVVERLVQPGALPLALADGMIENVIGTFELPLAVAANFQVNARDVFVPMVVEEPSIVAAASFMAKLVRDCGGFETSGTGPVMRAQIQVVNVVDPHAARLKLFEAREKIMEIANEIFDESQSSILIYQ